MRVRVSKTRLDEVDDEDTMIIAIVSCINMKSFPELLRFCQPVASHLRIVTWIEEFLIVRLLLASA